MCNRTERRDRSIGPHARLRDRERDEYPSGSTPRARTHPQTQSGLLADRDDPDPFSRGPTMRVQDVMTEDVQTISPADAAEDAWELMRTHGFHHVVATGVW